MRKPTNKENVEVNVNKNTDENEIYKNKIKIERIRIDKSIKTQINRHIHTKHTGKQLLYHADTKHTHKQAQLIIVVATTKYYT